MLDKLFTEFLDLSEKMRNGYIDSLGNASPTWEEAFTPITDDIPKVIHTIYSKVSGTYRDVENQIYMDFIPGYRLIHIEELKSEYASLLETLELDDVCEAGIKCIIPLLADYSSGYICYARTRRDEEIIYNYFPDDGFQRMCLSAEDFFKTIIAFYENDVYYSDDDGFLDYDFEKEGIVGAKCNPNINYWTE